MPLIKVADVESGNVSQYQKDQKEKEKYQNAVKSESLFKLIFISLTCAGFSWQPYWGTRNFCSKIFWRMYSLFILIIFLLQTLISIPCYKRPSTTPEIMTVVSSQLMCGFVVILWFCGLTLSGCTTKFVTSLDELREDCVFGKKISYEKFYRIMSRIIIGWNAVTLLSYPSIFIIMFKKENSFSEKQPCLANPLDEQSILLSSLETSSLIGLVYMVFVVNATLILFVTVCLILIKEFESCSKTLAEMTSESVEESSIDTCSRRHAAIVHLTDIAVTFLSKYVGIGYASSIIIVCFTIYNTISSSLNSVLLIQGIFFTYGSLIHLVIFTYFGIKVNTAAHSPIDVLHKLEGRKMTDRVIGLVALFTNKLSQSQIGISVMGLLVINKTTVLALIGTLLTYVFIAIQFKPDAAIFNQPVANASSEL